MKTFKIGKQYVDYSDILNEVGEALGMDWNYVCDLIKNHELYGQDGTGCCFLHKYDIENKAYAGDMSRIIKKLFDDNPEMETLIIIDDF